MPTFAALDHIDHANLKVKVQYGQEYGDNINQALVFPTEFQALQREYPIFFRQSDDKKFYAVVILGLDKDENLFLQDDQWSARYVPAVQMRGPFALEIKDSQEGNLEQADPLIRINMDDARVSNEQGESIFLPHGGYSPYFEDMLQALRRIHVGASVVDDFFSQLTSFNLIEPVTVQANISETVQYTVPDVFTISRSRMESLSGDELHKLNQLGLLEHCFAVLSSSGNVSRIIDMKLRKANVLG
ncbi:SapC family protein [Agarilytica rhodophyticola]|uniref:SapC family protein n=1 Tax=Agarilytica rhodophyticola TaxID=1737490 RepID=UPI000B3430D5|nr:SapC family protein [Agarilytica rhodophyticola]